MANRPALTAKAAALFHDYYGSQPKVIAWAPGRLNLIGGHTDYNEGLAMPTAINRWLVVAMRPRRDAAIRVHSIDYNDTMTLIPGDPSILKKPWQRYVDGAIKVFTEHAGFPGGFDALFLGDVPSGAGLSSSAALLVAWINALRTLTHTVIGSWDLVKLCQSVEHRFLGVQCGLLDQVASQFSRAEHVMKVDFRDLTLDYIPASMDDYMWIAVHSGKSRKLASSAYQDRVRECQQGLDALRASHPEVEHQRDIAQSMLSGTEVWTRRLRHVVTENQRVISMARALEAGSFQEVGELLTAAHHSLRDDYEVSCDELDTLIELGADAPGWLGGRMMGGGFGGCVINLVAKDKAKAFEESILTQYGSKYPQHKARAFSFLPSAGAGVHG